MLTYNVKDYGATGNGVTNDTAAIQAALDAARDAGGGRVYIPTGTYILTGTGDASDGAVRVYSNTELYGDGMGQTSLKLQDGWTSKITGMIRTPVGEVTSDVIIRDLSIDGNRANTTADVDGIMTGVLPGSPLKDNNILIDRVEIHDVSRIAFNPHEQTSNLTIRNSVAHHNSWDGFVGDYITNSVYENNVAFANDRHGFNIVTHSNNVALLNNTAYDNGDYGIIVQRGAGSQTLTGWQEMLNHTVLVKGNTVYGNDRGIVLKQTEDSQVIGNTVYANDREGIYLEGARENLVANNSVSGIGIAIGVRNYAGTLGGPGDSHHNVVINNQLQSGDYGIFESGTTTLYNTYGGNVMNMGVKLGATAIQLADTSGYTYTQINIVPTQPTLVTPPPPPPPAEDTTDKVISGTDSNDTLSGAAGNDTIKGRLGDDILNGGKGNDYLEGNAGNDVFYGGLGIDKMKGGDGVDKFIYKSASEGGDTIFDFRGNVGEKIDMTDVFASVPNFSADQAFTDGFLRLAQNGTNVEIYLDMDGLAGTNAAEVLFLTLASNSLSNVKATSFILPTTGSVTPPPPPPPVDDNPPPPPPPPPPVGSTVPTEGNDVLTGTAAKETIQGRGGDDIIKGMDGADTLYGNNGNDRLIGGLGADILKGGDGADTFVFEDILEVGDMILDFRSADFIDLGKLLEDFSGSVPTTVNQLVADGYLSVQSKGNNVFALNVDTDGAAGSATAVLLTDITVDVGKTFNTSSIVI